MKVAIFASATDCYVPKALAALLSFRRWHQEFGYYILGTKPYMRSETLRLIDKHGFELVDVDESKSLIRKRSFDKKFPIETVYLLKGPELMGERGFDFGIAIDGDTFSYRPLQLDPILPLVKGLAGRPVRSLSRTLKSKQLENNPEFDFSWPTLEDELGLSASELANGVEINGGFVIWNNRAMQKVKLFESCISITEKCKGCFEGNQDLMAFVVATNHIHVTPLEYNYHLLLAQSSKKTNKATENPLRLDASREYFGDVRVVHFINPKPWSEPAGRVASPAHAHFINSWREFVRHEFGSAASTFFGDLSPIQKGRYDNRWTSLSRFFLLPARLGYGGHHWNRRAQKVWISMRGERIQHWPRVLGQIWRSSKRKSVV